MKICKINKANKLYTTLSDHIAITRIFVYLYLVTTPINIFKTQNKPFILQFII